jgi:hypothetical protein
VGCLPSTAMTISLVIRYLVKRVPPAPRSSPLKLPEELEGSALRLWKRIPLTALPPPKRWLKCWARDEACKEVKLQSQAQSLFADLVTIAERDQKNAPKGVHTTGLSTPTQAVAGAILLSCTCMSPGECFIKVRTIVYTDLD